MQFNRRGGIYLLPLLKNFAENISATIVALASQEAEVNSWATIKAKPAIIRLCDEPAELIQPASPALVLSYSGRDVVTPEILYNYNVTASYVYASPVERDWGDDALYACMLAAEAIYQAAKQGRPAGVYSINYNGHDISSFMTTSGTTPLLSRILTVDLEFQMEEDY